MYRRKVKKAKMFSQFMIVLSLFAIVLIASSQIGVLRDFFGQASGENANIHVYTSKVLGTYKKPWRNLAQGGEDHEWRIGGLTQSVAALNPEYIRIDHIYDFYDVVAGENGNYSYNFSKLDLLIDDILATGAKPYIALSYMPTQFANGDITGQPDNYANWQSLVQRTIQHISGTRGISDVYYEVWNEPDLFGGWKYYGSKNYLNLYRSAAIGAKNTSGTKPFKLGGPATTGFYKNWAEALIKYAYENNLQLDFISWHRYSNNLDAYKDDMLSIRTLMRDYPQYEGQLEYHITEWGHDSENNSGYDTNYSAAHTVAGSIEMTGVVERAFAFEIQDGKDPEGKEKWGRWGMFTHNDFGAIAKPRYFALKMLDRISDQRVQLLGKGSWVKALAAKNPDTKNIEVVLANFDIKSQHSENVPILFEEITPGSYKITKELNTGQVFNETIATTEAKLRTTLFMPSNSVVFVTLEKLK
jgi:xylan 1,4-beta-xylosidase